MKILLILILQVPVIGQEVVPCYTINHIQVPALKETVEAALGNPINITKPVEMVFIKGNIYWFYNSVLWRIDHKGQLPCSYRDNVFWDNDVKVIRDGNRTSITSMHIWSLIVTDKSSIKRKN